MSKNHPSSVAVRQGPVPGAPAPPPAVPPARPPDAPNHTNPSMEIPEQGPPVAISTEPPPGRAPLSWEWLKEAEEYLEGHGWERCGRNEAGVSVWNDPAGAGPQTGQLSEPMELPAKGGGTETLRQLVVPPAAWSWPTEDALLRQRERDRAGQTGSQGTPLERLDRLGRRYDKLRAAVGQSAEELRKALLRPVPERQENLRQELIALKGRLTQIAQQLAAAGA